MISIQKIYKKDIPELLNNSSFWNHNFLAISKHRLYAHYKNPNSEPDDVVLLLAYIDDEFVGYMGVFMDKIILNNVEEKIGWLSTWWVHPKTKGTGIGREILNTMYEVQNGKIGISQFTPSAKRVYDKSGYFVTLKENHGIKAVLRSNLSFVVPALFSSGYRFYNLFDMLDNIINMVINSKIYLQKKSIQNRLSAVTLEYINIIDDETLKLINRYNKNHISSKGKDFFEWLKAYHWVQEAPLIGLTNSNRYEFSMCDKSFNIFMIKVVQNTECIGFLVLQKRSYVCKILFAYYNKDVYAQIMADIVKLQCVEQNVREIICYDEAMSLEFKKSKLFLYKRKKLKQSIISKKFNSDNFQNLMMNFGDGDCSFA